MTPFTLPFAEVHGAKIKALASSLDDEDTEIEAIELLRGHVTEVRPHPDAVPIWFDLGVMDICRGRLWS